MALQLKDLGDGMPEQQCACAGRLWWGEWIGMSFDGQNVQLYCDHEAGSGKF